MQLWQITELSSSVCFFLLKPCFAQSKFSNFIKCIAWCTCLDSGYHFLFSNTFLFKMCWISQRLSGDLETSVPSSLLKPTKSIEAKIKLWCINLTIPFQVSYIQYPLNHSLIHSLRIIFFSASSILAVRAQIIQVFPEHQLSTISTYNAKLGQKREASKKSIFQ